MRCSFRSYIVSYLVHLLLTRSFERSSKLKHASSCECMIHSSLVATPLVTRMVWCFCSMLVTAVVVEVEQCTGTIVGFTPLTSYNSTFIFPELTAVFFIFPKVASQQEPLVDQCVLNANTK